MELRLGPHQLLSVVIEFPLGMLLAVVVTLLRSGLDYQFIILGLIVGGIIGLIAANRVQMNGMPELVALFYCFGGFESLLVGCS